MDNKPNDEKVANPSTEFEKPKDLIKDVWTDDRPPVKAIEQRSLFARTDQNRRE
jgi:hypothetical protein